MTNFVGLFQSQCMLKKIAHKIIYEQTAVGFKATLDFNSQQVWAEASTKREAKRKVHELALALLVNESGYSERSHCPHITSLVDNIGVANIPEYLIKSSENSSDHNLSELAVTLFQSIESGSFQAYSEFKRILKVRGYKTHQDGGGSIHIWRCV
uniref:Uncharacterized protein n=1 Tax=viral metagenome TaxID=1070528 RepID=A0A2V0RLL7_9ZZZZ